MAMAAMVVAERLMIQAQRLMQLHLTRCFLLLLAHLVSSPKAAPPPCVMLVSLVWPWTA